MSANNNRLSPRQKMINLMYIVLTAMLALNVSSDVLDGFTQVDEGLARSNANVEQRNSAILGSLDEFSRLNPEKGAAWLNKAVEVRNATSRIYNLVDSFKRVIVTEADGRDGDPADIKNRDDLESASVVMLSPANSNGRRLRSGIESYRDYVLSQITDTMKRRNISEALSTAPVAVKGNMMKKSWEEAKFDNQPVVAAITLLTKLQSDIRYAEGEVLASLLDNVDAGDVRVNELNALVIPDSRIVMRGGNYTADIVLAAVDTTQRPEITVNGARLDNDRGRLSIPATRPGSFDFNGHVELKHDDGSVTRHPFTSSYTVIEPSATVSATMMNVLYAGIDNPVSISVPGIPSSAISASMTNGTLTRKGDTWTAHPSKIGQEAVITVTAMMDGRRQEMAKTHFRVRRLPDPAPYLNITDSKGNADHYRGGRPIQRQTLLAASGIGAAIDDDMLNIPFRVISFETMTFDSMGNAIPEVSDGANFSRRQKESFRRMQRGKRFYISNIKVIGPDGISRTILPLEIKVN